MIAVFSTIFFGGPGRPEGIIFVMIGFFTVIYSLFALPSIIAGYALLKKKSWARIASIVAGVIAGMNMPIGTAACVYALWFFYSENWKEVYPEVSAPRFEERKQIPYGVESQRAAYAEEERQPKFDPHHPPDWR